MKLINAGSYDHKIIIGNSTSTKSADGFTDKKAQISPVLEAWAKVKTTKGYTLIASGTDFEKAYTNFTIRYPKVAVTRKMFVVFNSKIYSIMYINNVDEANIELELQCKEVSI